jgi:hypothetical protein
MRPAILVCLAIVASSLPVHAQNTQPSRWGAIGSVVPRWEIPPSLEPIATLHFSEDDAPIKDLDLRGGELRIGIARGRMLSGDWGVSYVRRTYVDRDIEGRRSPGCQGSQGPGQSSFVQECEELWTNLGRRDVRLNGLEVHKFVSFATIAQRVQIGMNFGGGFGSVNGNIDTTSFRSTFRCTFPPGTLPPYFDPNFEFTDDFHPCTGSTISNLNTVQTGSSSGDVTRMLTLETSKTLPIGRVEIAGAVLVGPSFKVRVAGGLNYPGTSAISVTGLYFFGSN